MTHAVFRFYEELNDFLPPERRKVAFDHPLDRRAAVKDVIERSRQRDDRAPGAPPASGGG
ncbi:hypothetical protein ACN2MM_13750 [Alkalilimnicola ehrlichii MLHE-1]|uniref:hypothetical protein n=1 Tax=Alkalilimnicola ehrlichii TaxID=351052 RepID=UPI00005DF836|nr:hypothetical protein [Alkalilimnicola ehrlichii]